MAEREDDIDDLLKHLFREGEGPEYLGVANSVGQQWLLPADHIRVGSSLYHASRLRGKMVKMLLPAVVRSSFLRARTGAVMRKLQPQPALREVLVRLFGDGDMVLAVFCGSPGRDRKITLQVSRCGVPLGYCKISGRDVVKQSFAAESDLLGRLHALGMAQLPRSLFCGGFMAGTDLFVQDTAKKERPARGRGDEDLVWDFLCELHEKTSDGTPFVESEYCKTLENLKSGIQKYRPEASDVLLRTISQVETYFKSNDTRFSRFHGDLTPWNTFVHDGRLYAFDWEYSKPAYPPFLDFFHYFTQSAHYGRRWSAGRICRAFRAQEDRMRDYLPAPATYYKAYLLAVIWLYLDRNDWRLDASINTSYRLWINILAVLNEKAA
ncbi:phosphotransferase [uncultured Alistipes sp.]|uniref:phosphotransferase n=1 Tax=uncultured Alistipes sp. TaxID=538949 RepID=UPI0025E713BD|nr:phosphotransferase [uncultured Alistipes sp.]